jgi:hypothetical protein
VIQLVYFLDVLKGTVEMCYEIETEFFRGKVKVRLPVQNKIIIQISCQIFRKCGVVQQFGNDSHK